METRVTDLENAVFGNLKLEEAGVVKTVKHIDTEIRRIKNIVTGVAIGVTLQLVVNFPAIVGLVNKIFSGF